MNKVSIIVPVYNVEQYIEQCVQQKWTKQLECAQRVRDNLTAIIGRLQE